VVETADNWARVSIATARPATSASPRSGGCEASRAGRWGLGHGAGRHAQRAAQVTLWARDPLRCAQMQAERTNQRYLPGITLPAALQLTSDQTAALAGAEVAIPRRHRRRPACHAA
jgi:hypothetical protein